MTTLSLRRLAPLAATVAWSCGLFEGARSETLTVLHTARFEGELEPCG